MNMDNNQMKGSRNGNRVIPGMQPGSQVLPDEQRFIEYLDKLPEEEQFAVTLISKNIVNGCSWEFVRDVGKLRRLEKSFMKNPNVSLTEVNYHQGNRAVPGYLVYMKLDYLLKTLHAASSSLITPEDAKKASEKRQSACISLAKKLEKGYSGVIGIYCTNDSEYITISGKSFPAYAVTFAEFCQIAVKMGYGVKYSGGVASAQQCMQNAAQIIKGCEVAPSSNALLISVAPLRGNSKR